MAGFDPEEIKHERERLDKELFDQSKDNLYCSRPTEWSQELQDKICAQLSMGFSLRTVCRGDGMPEMSSVFKWFRTKEGFLQAYDKAKQEASDAMSEDIQNIADDSVALAKGVDPKASAAMVNAARLKVDTRKWIMSKMKPSKYGEKLDFTTNGKDLPSPIYASKSSKE